MASEHRTSKNQGHRRIVGRAEFRRLLQKQPSQARYKPCSSEECPLAAFSGYYVDDDTYGDSTHDYMLPKWAREFRSLFDNRRSIAGPKLCLTILEDV